jgi:predicted porin
LTRASNAVKYSSANYGGFNFGALYSFGAAHSGGGNTNASSGEDTTFSDNNKYWEAHVGYAMKPFAVDFAHGVSKSETALGSEDAKRNQLVGKWDTGAFGVAVGYATDKTDDADVLDRRVVWVQPGFRFGGNNELYASWAKAKDKTADKADSTWIGVAYRHLFTKRTYAYASYGQTSNDNGAGQTPYSYAGPAPTGLLGLDEDAKAFNVGLAQEF